MTLKLREAVFLSEIQYGIALLDEDSGQYWDLNPTAALILQTLLAGGTHAHAAEELSNQYEVDMDSASQDVQELVGELRTAGLAE